MRSFVLSIIAALTCANVFGQSTRIIIVGTVADAITKEPLAFATVGVRSAVDEAVSRADGSFELSVSAALANDTLVVSYIGYNTFTKPVAKLASVEQVYLNEVATVLNEVTVTQHRLDLRDVDRDMRKIRDNLYAMAVEVTNADFNDFLNYLEDFNQAEKRKRYDFDLSAYSKSEREFFKRYQKSTGVVAKKKDTVLHYDAHPAVNITYEAAVAYCDWLTERYNENQKKKKFKNVRFRLPTLNEWQISALGYDKFQSWNLMENDIVVNIPDDSTKMEIYKGTKKTIRMNESIKYPWYFVYHYRNTVVNSKGCILGNFRIESAIPCPAQWKAYDGYSMTAPVGHYFPNNMGLLDVVGNVAEMISEKGKACGGSWNDLPEHSTIQSIKSYDGPDQTVGFRVFMEVLE